MPNQIKPMKLRELLSAFRSEEELLLSIFQQDNWREPFLGYYLDRKHHLPKREILDMLVPLELSRQVCSNSKQLFFFKPAERQLFTYATPKKKFFEKITMRLSGIPVAPEEEVAVLTALDIHERFGGSIIEEVLEFGSATVQPE